MRDSIYRFTLDVHDISSQVQIVAKKNDNARTIKTNLMEYGKPYVIEEGCRAVIMIKKPDGNILFNDCDISGSEIRYEFTEQTTSIDGLCECEIRLFDPEGETITSPRFTMLVNDTVYDAGQIESTSEFKVLTDAITSADNLNIEAEKEDSVTTVTITHKDGTQKTVNIEDGLPGAIINTKAPTGDFKPALWIDPDGVELINVEPNKIDDDVTNRYNTWSSAEVSSRINATKSEITSNLKTINGQSVVGTGNIEIQGGGSSIDDTTTSTDKTWSSSKIDSLKSEFVGVTDLDGTTIYKGADNKIHAKGGSGSVDIDNNSIITNTDGNIEVADYEELRQKYGGFTPIGVDIPLEWNLGQYWNTASKSISTNVTTGQWARVEIEPNVEYAINGCNFYNGRLVGIYDENMNLLMSYPSVSNINYYEYEFVAPSNAKWLYTNTLTSAISSYSLQKKAGRRFNGFNTFVKDQLWGKSLLVFGDSIARGARANNQAFGELIAKRNGMTINNISIGGATLAVRDGYTNSEVEQIKGHTVNHYDFIVFDGGTNDFEKTIDIGTLGTTYTENFDNTKVIGAMEDICKYLKANYKDSKILFVLTHKRIKYPSVAIKQNTYWDALISVCEKWSIPYVDMRLCGLADFGAEWEQTYFSNDQGGDTHPNELGYEMFYVPTIEQKMQSL